MEFSRSYRKWVIIAAVLSVIAMIGVIIKNIIFPPRCQPNKYYLSEPCNDSGIDTLKFKANHWQANGELTTKEVWTTYVCNEIILSPKVVGPTEAEKLRNYLICMDFGLKEICSCTDSLERWKFNDDQHHVDIIGVIKDPSPSNAKPSGGGLSPNFIINWPTTITTIPDSSSDYKENPDPNISGKAPVKIVVTDTGIEPSSASILNGYLWKDGLSNPAYKCPNRPLGGYGLNLYPPSNVKVSEPIDKLGHGTHVTGIIIGAENPSSQESIPFQIITAKIINDGSKNGTLFNAVCGLYYGLKQGAKVFNISWGYLDIMGTNAHRIFEPFLKEARNNQSVIVAGMGNDTVLLDKNVKFWPASFAETYNNVISVGAIDNNGNLADFSNIGDANMMSVTALGVDVVSLGLASGGTAKCSGTSMATPFVTRTAAVLKGKDPNINAVDIKSQIITKSNLKTSPQNLKYRLLNHVNSVK